MLDENLPNFYLKANEDGVKHHQAYFFSQHGSDPEPTYDLHHLDPAAPNSKNTYAAALFDSHNTDVLYGEVLLRPGWTHPTLSQEEIRKNGGVAPPSQPLLPTSFTIQLYEPDQQVEIYQRTSKWSNSNWYEFSLPQQSFRTPSSSTLDRSRIDPSADATTPKLNFVWKRESRISKDMTCFLTGKSTDSDNKKKKNQEPDIAVALFSGLKDLTIYETNLYRVEMEDYKGLEVILLLSAAVIKEVYFGDMKETFHLEDYGRKNSAGKIARKNSSPIMPSGASVAPFGAPPLAFTQSPRQLQQAPYIPPPGQPGAAHKPVQSTNPSVRKRQSLPPLQTGTSRPPPQTDPREQWIVEQATARLRAETENHQRQEEYRRQKQLKQDVAEAQRFLRLMQAEEKEQLRKQAEVDKETERLRKKYGTQGQSMPPPQPQRPHQRAPHSQPQPAQRLPPQQQHRPQVHTPRQPNGLWTVPQGRVAQPPARPAQSSGWHLQASRPVQPQQQFFGGGGQLKPANGQTLSKPKRSFFGLRTSDEGSHAKVTKKKSSMF